MLISLTMGVLYGIGFAFLKGATWLPARDACGSSELHPLPWNDHRSSFSQLASLRLTARAHGGLIGVVGSIRGGSVARGILPDAEASWIEPQPPSDVGLRGFADRCKSLRAARHHPGRSRDCGWEGNFQFLRGTISWLDFYRRIRVRTAPRRGNPCRSGQIKRA